MKRLLKLCTSLLLLILAPAVIAQPDSCPVIVNNVLDLMDQNCSETGRNQVCYGNVNIVPTLQPGVTDIQFDLAGDIEDVVAFQSLRLSPINGDTNEWGVALMRLQANLPDTLPGQNVTFVLFGDVEMTSAVDPNSDANPMQAFYLSTGIGMTSCNEAPPSGLLVQTPVGAGQVEFAMNGMNISLGSSAFIQAMPGQSMNVSMLDGAGALEVNGQVIPALEGTQVTLPLDVDLLVGPTFTITAFNSQTIATVPLDLLDQTHFNLAEPLDQATLALLLQRWAAGEPICGEGLPWNCANLPRMLGGTLCPLDEAGQPDCNLPRLNWGDEGFGISLPGAQASGGTIQPLDGVWETTNSGFEGTAGCPAMMLDAMQANTEFFSSESVVFPKPFNLAEFMRNAQGTELLEIVETRTETNLYEITYSVEGGFIGLYTFEVVSESEVNITLHFDLSASGFDCQITWQGTGMHTGS